MRSRKRDVFQTEEYFAQNSMCEGLDTHGNMTHLRNREEVGRAGSLGASWGVGEAERLQVPDSAGSRKPR